MQQISSLSFDRRSTIPLKHTRERKLYHHFKHKAQTKKNICVNKGKSKLGTVSPTRPQKNGPLHRKNSHLRNLGKQVKNGRLNSLAREGYKKKPGNEIDDTGQEDSKKKDKGANHKGEASILKQSHQMGGKHIKREKDQYRRKKKTRKKQIILYAKGAENRLR